MGRQRQCTSIIRSAAVLLACLALAVTGCGSGDGPSEDALASATLDPAWNPPIAGSTTGIRSQPETGDLLLAVVLRNASVDTRLRLGAAAIAGGTGIEVVRLGLQPVAEREEPGIAFPEEPLGVIDSLVLPAQHHAVLRAELRPDCDTVVDADLQITVTDGTTRTELRLDDLATTGGPGWVSDAVATFCAGG
jgi:hypothetical protein